MGLKVNLDDVEAQQVDTESEEVVKEGWMRNQKVYGKRVNLAVFERGMYHSSPHQHEAEQLNYILEGKVWWFVEDEGYLLTPNDFHRVPSNAVHWARVEEAPVKMIEAHSPVLATKGSGYGLFTDDEVPEPDEPSENLAVEVEGWEEKEEQMMEAYYEANPENRPG